MSDLLSFQHVSGISVPPISALEPYKCGRRNFAFFRTAAFRLAFIYAMVFGISFFALSFTLWRSTSGLLDQRTEDSVRMFARTFAASYKSGGLLALTGSIKKTLETPSAQHALFLLVDRRGDRIAGNLDEWPRKVFLTGKWYHLALRLGTRPTTAFYRCYGLRNGFKLLVGHDSRTEDHLLAILKRGMGSLLLEMIAICLVGASMIRLLVKRAVTDLSAIADAVTQGDMSKRIVQRSFGYEFDRIAIAVNEILDKVTGLLESVKNVSNSLAHDLRTPITRVRIRLEDAVLHAGEEDQLREAIRLATDDLDGVINIFQALLRIAEVESGTRRSAFREFDIVQSLSDLAEMYEAVADERDIELIKDYDPQLIILGDDQMIQQAVANLLSNAIKFSSPMSTVRLSARSDGQTLSIVVEDSGPGIPEADRERAIERFYRAEVARHTPGSGLGLALVAAVCSLHGGVLTLEENAPGLKASMMLPRRWQ